MAIFFIPLALAAFDGRPTLLPYVPFPIGIILSFVYLIADLTQAASLDAKDFTLVINLSLVLQMQHFIIISFFYCENQIGLLPFLSEPRCCSASGLAR